MEQMELITTYICKKGDIGVHDNMFGGTLVSLIDDASAAYAAQICDTPMVVTIKIDELIFKKAVKVNALLKIYGKVIEFVVDPYALKKTGQIELTANTFWDLAVARASSFTTMEDVITTL